VAESPCLEIAGRPTVLACPICRSVLYEVADENDSRFRCTEGHDFSLDEICPGIEESLSGLFSQAVEAVMKIDR
jgi:hypothetical protein